MRKLAALTSGAVGPTVDESVPVADEGTNNWVLGAGTGPPWFEDLNDGYLNFDDATTYWKSFNASATPIDMKMGTIPTPSSPSTMNPRWRTSDGASTTMVVKLEIWEGVPGVGTLRGTDTQTTAGTGTWETWNAGMDLSAVTDWSDLYARVYTTQGTSRMELTGVSINQT